MKLLSFLFASVAAAELTFSATAVQDGKEVDTSGLEFVPIPPRSRSHFRHNVSNYTADASTYAVREKRHNEKRLSVSLSSNWCGVSQHAESNDPLTSVSGFFSAPNLHDRTGTYPQYGAAWIGMDGASCQQTLLQAGVTTILNSNGQQSAYAWWEWVPKASYAITGFKVAAGEWISVNVSASSNTDAQITINNVDRGYSLTLTVINGPALCRADADWMVEDFFSEGKQVPFARFDDIWFEEAVATTSKGKSIGLKDAAMIYLGKDVASASCLAQPFDDANFWCQSQG